RDANDERGRGAAGAVDAGPEGDVERDAADERESQDALRAVCFERRIEIGGPAAADVRHPDVRGDRRHDGSATTIRLDPGTTLISPPCMSTIQRAMASPRPLPPSERVRAL